MIHQFYFWEKEDKNIIGKNTCTTMLIIAVFPTHKKEKKNVNLTCIEKMWYIYSMGYTNID